MKRFRNVFKLELQAPVLYLTEITKITTTTSKTTKEPKQKSRLGTASNKITLGGGGGAL